LSEAKSNPIVGSVGLDEFDRRVLSSWVIKVISGVGMSWSLIVEVYIDFYVFWEIVLLSPEDLYKLVAEYVCLGGRHSGNNSVFQEFIGKPNLC